ncbi:uncharacterized protein [Aristolochia californica]|uniref:uncharacterized protein n=1 Tax=Aristolochia californica TaxID=171875 RepID=UPI0035DABD2B
MSSLVLLFLLFSLSVNACTGARLLSFVGTKDFKKVELHSHLSSSQKLHQVDENQAAGVKAVVQGETRVGATVEKKTKDAEDLPSKIEVTAETSSMSGNEYEMSSSDVGLQEATELEGTGRRLGSRSDVGNVDVADEESRESSGSGVVAGVFSRDYEQPQRKPPIHN